MKINWTFVIVFNIAFFFGMVVEKYINYKTRTNAIMSQPYNSEPYEQKETK